MTNGLPSATESCLKMNELWKFALAVAGTAVSTMFFGLIAKAYWVLFMLGWGVL